MPKHFVRRTYDAWIERNRDGFRFLPSITESRKQGFTLHFDGLAPQLTFVVQHGGDAACFIHDLHGVYWDMVATFDLLERRTPDGHYFCRICDPSDFYPSRAALWEAHVFEPMRDWVNDLTPEHWVCLYGEPFRSFWGARLVRPGQTTREACVVQFPIVTRPAS